MIQKDGMKSFFDWQEVEPLQNGIHQTEETKAKPQDAKPILQMAHGNLN